MLGKLKSKKGDLRLSVFSNKRAGVLYSKKAFTLIELIVVIAIIAILVLLAMPKLMGFTERAKVTQIKNDIKAVETVTGIYMLENGELPDGVAVTKGELEGKTVYDKKGIMDSIEDKNYRKLDKGFVKDKTKSKLDGDFVSDDEGEIIYVDDVTGEEVDKELADDEIDKLIEEGYVPIASGAEMQQINNDSSEKQLFGASSKWEGQYVGKLDSKFIQVNDIDLDSYDSWVSIGIDPGVPFTGEFDGGNFTISNLSIGNDGWFDALFGDIEQGSNGDKVVIRNIKIDGYSSSSGAVLINSTGMNNGVKPSMEISIENITIKNGFINADNKTNIGSIVAHLRSATLNISNINVDGSIKAEDSNNSGGVIGFVNNDVEGINMKDINIAMDIVGSDRVGGVIGAIQTENIVVNNVKFDGSIKGNDVGGFVGLISGDSDEHSKVTLENLDISGIIKGNTSAGGILGNLSADNTVIFKDSQFNGELYGDVVGGIIAEANNQNVSLKNLTTGGNYIGEEAAGGIVGRFSIGPTHKMERLNSSSKVSAELAGGIVGVVNGGEINIIDSKYTGEVSSLVGEVGEAGGIIGRIHGSASITGSSVSGIISGSNAGGLIGAGHVATIIVDKSNVNSKITGDKLAGGVVGNAISGSVTINNSKINGDINGGLYSGLYIGQVSGESLENIEINSDPGSIPNIGFFKAH